MSNAIGSALSGLAAASRRIEVSANNIANQNSTSTQVGGVTTNQPFIPQDVVQISLGAGGVRTDVRDSGNPAVKLFDPENPNSDEYGFINSPNVDLADEMIKMQVASYDFKANLKVIKAADSMEQSLLDMLS